MSEEVVETKEEIVDDISTSEISDVPPPSDETPEPVVSKKKKTHKKKKSAKKEEAGETAESEVPAENIEKSEL